MFITFERVAFDKLLDVFLGFEGQFPFHFYR